MTEVTDDSWPPAYKNELSNFKKETLEKIEEFRAARDNWIATDSNQIINKSTKEGLYKSDEYKGRCSLLRRIRFKTTFLRFHHKTLRPLKFYTFKPKLSDTGIERVINESLEKSKICTEKYKNLASTDYLQKSEEKRKSKNRSKNENFAAKKIYGSKKVTKNLKAQKLERRLVDSCKCDGKKGLTVVIKGVCLCDKTALNKLTLGEVCSGYSKLELKNTVSAEPKLSRTTDSLEIYKKRSQYRLEKIKEEKENTATQAESPFKKKVKFKHPKGNTEVKKEFIAKNDEVPTHKSAKTDTKSTKNPLTKWSGIKKECKQNTIKEKHKYCIDNINILKSHAQKNLMTEQKKVTEDILKTKPTEGKIKTGDFNESTITLYKNKQQEQSYLNLTKEQQEKMKMILEQNNKKIKK